MPIPLPRSPKLIWSLALLILVSVLSACGEDPTVSPQSPSLRLLNFKEPVTVGIGGPLVVLFEVDPGAGIKIVELHWRTEGGEWHHVANAMAQDGMIMFAYDTFQADRIQLRIQSSDPRSEDFSAWITIDHSRMIQPIKLLKPTWDAHFSVFDLENNIIEWEIDPVNFVREVIIFCRHDTASVWKPIDTVDAQAIKRYVWLTPPKEIGTYFLRLQAAGYFVPTDEVRIQMDDISGIRILEPSGGRIYYTHKGGDPLLKWVSSLSQTSTSVEVEYTYNAGNWRRLGTYDGGQKEIPLLPTLSNAGFYRLRMRHSGSNEWIESDEFRLVRFSIGLSDGATSVKRGSPWLIDKDVASAGLWPACHEPYVHFFISSDGGASWEKTDVYGDVVNVRPGPMYILRMTGTRGTITLSDTTKPFSVTENLSEFFPPLTAGTSFLFHNWSSSMSYGQNHTTRSDTLELQILSATEQVARVVFSARKRIRNAADSSWVPITITEQKSDLHRIDGLPTGTPMYRYLDSDLQSHLFYVRTSCDPEYFYPYGGLKIQIERGIGVVYRASGTTYSQMSNSGSGWTFIRRW